MEKELTPRERVQEIARIIAAAWMRRCQNEAEASFSENFEDSSANSQPTP